MRVFWDTVEKLDHATFAALDKIDRMLGRDTYQKRAEKAVEHVRKPQKAIRFES